MPSSKVVFSINEPISRLLDWLKSSFIVPSRGMTGIKINSTNTKLKANFIAVCPTSNSIKNEKFESNRNYSNSQMLYIFASEIKSEDSTNGSRPFSSLRLEIFCDSMELAGELTQDICKFFSIEDLESEAIFPSEMKEFENVLSKVAELNTDRLRLNADMAEDSLRVKVNIFFYFNLYFYNSIMYFILLCCRVVAFILSQTLIIRAEDSRLVSDMESMRRAYTDLYSLNNQLIGNYNVRAKSHEDLLSSLKEVNQMIQRAANLRAGQYKTRVINEFRAAVKSNNIPLIFKIIKYGYENNNSTLNKKQNYLS